MELDPITVCIRSFAGEAEVRKATHGLSLVQRRILMLLDRPRTLVAFAAWARENTQYGSEPALDGLLRWAQATFPCPASPPSRSSRRTR